MLLLLHKTLKGSRNIQGFALIRAVLLNIKLGGSTEEHQVLIRISTELYEKLVLPILELFSTNF